MPLGLRFGETDFTYTSPLNGLEFVEQGLDIGDGGESGPRRPEARVKGKGLHYRRDHIQRVQNHQWGL